MSSLAIIEYTIAFVLCISTCGLFSWYKTNTTNKWPAICLLLSILWLIIDATVYILNDYPKTPFIILYIVNFAAYTLGPAIYVIFIKYREQYIAERTTLKKWEYHIPMIILSLIIVIIIEEFIRGSIVVFENGVVVEDNGLPIIISLAWLMIFFYLPFFALSKRKAIGIKTALLLGFADFILLISALISKNIDIDLTVCFGSLEMFFTVTVLQRSQLEKANTDTNEANIRNLLLYDIIQGKKWSYTINENDEVVGANYSQEALAVVKAKKSTEKPMDWVNYVHPEDKETVLNAFYGAIKDHSGKTPYEITYRIMRKDKVYIWLKSSGRLIHHKDGTGELFGMCIDISEQIEKQQKQKKEELDKINRTLNMVFALSNEYDPIIVIDPVSGEYDWLMSMSEDVVNNTSMTKHGENIYQNIGIDGDLIIHEEDRLRYEAFYSKENMMKIAETGETQETENRWYIHSENCFRWKYNKAVRMFDDNEKPYVVVGVIDTTEKKAKEEEFKKQRKLIEEQQSLSDGLSREYHTVWLLEGHGEHRLHLYRSTGKKTIQKAVQFGLDEQTYDHTIVKYVMECVHEDDRERVLEAAKFETVERETPDVGIYVISYKRYCDDEGNIDYHQMCFAKAVAEIGTINYIVAFRDADKMLREQIAQQQQLEEARIAAEASNKAKTNFLFNMSHDIRTPMNAITGFTNMAIRHIDEKERVLDYLSKVQQSENILLSLINNVLEVSKIESGHIALDEQPGDVYLSFINIEDTMKELAGTKNINLSFKIDDIYDRYVYCDFTRCLRIFVNVITNAIKYTPEGGTVKVSCKQVNKAKDGYANYQYVIEDNGIGMSEEFQEHIFDQFARENSATVSGIQGTGLGMSVVKSFIDLMGGTIKIRSKKGKGSTFTITLPFKLQEGKLFTEPDITKTISESMELIDAKKVDFTGKCVLLVEDNEFNREIAREILEESGFVVEEAEDGTIAVEKLKEKGSEYYDFILMDIQMPLMNGYDATKAIRNMYPTAKLPIIALSANAFAEDKLASLEAGMDAHVAKPIEIKELFNILSKYLSR